MDLIRRTTEEVWPRERNLIYGATGYAGKLIAKAAVAARFRLSWIVERAMPILRRLLQTGFAASYGTRKGTLLLSVPLGVIT